MSIAACAALVERGDPDRFRAGMAAPRDARAQLFPLYAFNLEVARAPWVTEEPLIAEMRLQWWRDVVANAASGAAKAHEVAGPLHELIRDFGLPVNVLDQLVEARRWDIHSDPFADRAALEAYIEATGAGLVWLAARALGAPDSAEEPIRAYGWAAGLAAFLQAVPALQGRGRQPIPPDSTLQDLATAGLARLEQARAARRSIPKEVAPALLPGWLARPILTQIQSAPEVQTAVSEFRKRGRLLWQATTGRWWG